MRILDKLLKQTSCRWEPPFAQDNKLYFLIVNVSVLSGNTFDHKEKLAASTATTIKESAAATDNHSQS
jgi:hypothetical protein